MKTSKPDALTPEEFRSLKDLGTGHSSLLGRRIPSEIKAKLLKLGFVIEQKDRFGGVSLTVKGEQRLKAGK